MIADWVGGLLVIFANYLIGKRDRFGWLVNITAQIPLMYLNYKLKLWGLFPMNAFLTVVFIKNYVNWLKDDSRTKADRRQRERLDTPEGVAGNTSTVESATGWPRNNPPSAR